MCRIALLSDQPVLVMGFRQLLQGSDCSAIAPVTLNSAALIREVESLQPEVVLLDWNSEWTFGVLSDFCGRLPHLRVILVVRNPSPELVYQAHEAGLAGLLDTRCSRDEVLALVERCDSDEFSFDCPDGMELRRAKTVHMTPREGQLVCLLAQGCKNKEIATVLKISEGTVKVYLSKLFQKTGAKDRFEMALFGLKNMVVPGPGGAGHNGDHPVVHGSNGIAGLSTLVVSEPAGTGAARLGDTGAHPQSKTGFARTRDALGFRPFLGGDLIRTRH